jgi:hypothetical protein
MEEMRLAAPLWAQGRKQKSPPFGAAMVVRSDMGLVVQDDIQQGVIDFQFPIVFDIAQLSEFVHEMADA